MKDNGVASQLNTNGGANTHRFKSFKQRIEGIEINVSRRVINNLEDEPEEFDSYFAEALVKWQELNCTSDFSDFLSLVREYRQSLAQILYHKEVIVDILERYLTLDHEDALEPILDLVSTLARDLQDEFMPFYPRLVKCLIPLIKSNSPEAVEWSCNALAYLFKYLAKWLVGDLRSTFILVTPLLGIEGQRSHTRRFGSESLSFLIRKLRGEKLQSFVGYVVRTLKECPQNRLDGFRDGVSLLFFECMRGVDSRLHSRATNILLALLHELYNESYSSPRLEDNQVYLLNLSVLKLCLHYARRDTATQLWSVLFEEYTAQFELIKEGKTGNPSPFCALLGLLSSATILRKGSRVSDYKPLFQHCRSAFEVSGKIKSTLDTQDPEDHRFIVDIFTREKIKWLIGLLLQADVADTISIGRVLLDTVFKEESVGTILSMSLTLSRFEWTQWNQILLPYLVQLTLSKWSTDSTSLVLFWAELFQKKLFNPHSATVSSVITDRGKVIFPLSSSGKMLKGKKTKSAKSSSDTDVSSIPQLLISWLLEPVDWTELLDHPSTIPSDQPVMFNGFADAGIGSSASYAKNYESNKSIPNNCMTEISIKSAILCVLRNISVDSTLLLETLEQFSKNIAGHVASLSAQLINSNDYLRHISSNPGKHNDLGPSEGKIWGDEASKALGLYTAKGEMLYWGAFHNITPLVNLLGTSLQLEADSAQHAENDKAAVSLLNRWAQIVDEILPAHHTNQAIIQGLYKTAEALRYIANTDSKNTLSLNLKKKINNALSCAELEKFLSMLQLNLIKFQPTLRMATLQLLGQFEQFPLLDPTDANGADLSSGKKAKGERSSIVKKSKKESKSNNGKEMELCPVIQIAIEFESIEPTLTTYKDKMNYLRRLTVLATNGRIPKPYSHVFPYISLAHLSVNFGPIWPEVIKQMGLLASANPNLFWSAVWGMMERFNDERQLIESGPSPEAKKWLSSLHSEWDSQTEYKTLPKLDGHAIECPNLSRFERVFGDSIRRFDESTGPSTLLNLQILSASSSSPDFERVDYTNIRKQLLKILGEVGALAAEPQSKPLVETFLAFINSEFKWTALFYESHKDLRLNVDLSDICAMEYRGLLTETSRRHAESIGALWLKLFAKFRRPRSLYQSASLYSIYLRLLSKGDNAIQLLALECLFTWKQPEVMPYADNLRNLLNETKFRDELTVFDMSVNGDSINSVHRAGLMPLLLRLLYGQTMIRNARTSRKDGMKIRRISVISAMVGLSQSELYQFVSIGLESFGEILSMATPADRLTGNNPERFELALANNSAPNAMETDDGDDDDDANGAKQSEVPARVLLSFMHLLSDLVKQLGFKATIVFHESIVILLHIIRSSQIQLDAANRDLTKLLESSSSKTISDADVSDTGNLDDAVDDDSDNDNDDDGDLTEASNPRGMIERRRREARTLRQMAIKVITELFTLQPPEFRFEPYMSCIFDVAINPRLEFFDVENTQSPSAILLMFRSWSLTPKYIPYLTEYSPLLFKMLLDILVAPKVHPTVVTLVLDILQTFLDYTPEKAMEDNVVTEEIANECGNTINKTIQAHVSQILANMKTCFANTLSASKAKQIGKNNIVMREIHILSRVANYATEQVSDAKALLDLLLPILRRPNGVVPERTKADILSILLRFIPMVLNSAESDNISDEERRKLFTIYLDAISSCFGRLRLQSARKELTKIMLTLAQIDAKWNGDIEGVTPLVTAAKVIEEINSYSTRRLEEPDFERRLAAYAHLNVELWCADGAIDAVAWVPILQNLTFFAQDYDEMSIRANASHGICRFITRVSNLYKSGSPEGSLAGNSSLPDEVHRMGRNLTEIVIPSIKHAFTSKHDSVRTEFVTVLRNAVRECGEHFDQLRDLTVLDNKDEEANFFYNIVHIQLHRRLRALRRFRALINPDRDESGDNDIEMAEGDESDGEWSEDGAKVPSEKPKSADAILPFRLDAPECPLSLSSVRDLFIPYFEHWVVSTDSEVNHELINDALVTIGSISAVLPWSQYHSLLRKYLGMIKRSPQLEKRFLRLVLAIIDNFHFDVRGVKADSLGRLLSSAKNAPSSSLAAHGEDPNTEDNGDMDIDHAVESEEYAEQRIKELQAERIHETLVHYLIPELKAKVSVSDEDTMVLRAPVAMAVTRLLSALPERTLNLQLPGLLTTICNMLRVRAQSSRNATRDTLIRIAKFLGPSYFGFIVKELKTSLSRGFHKHILGYTLYTLLKEISRLVEVGDLDYTLELMIEILVQDIFGQTGEEKDAEGWTTKIKEAKVHHGPDCFEILASITAFDNMRLMLAPLRDILQETETPKRTSLADTVLHRISIGLNRNRSYNTKTVLVFSHRIINQYLALSAKGAKGGAKAKEQVDLQKRLRPTGDELVTVHMRSKDVVAKRDYLATNAHRFVRFGLDIIYFGLKRDRFDTKESETLGLLDPFVDLTGNGLYSRYNTIITMCCKIWTILVRLPLPSLTDGIPVVIRRLFELFKQASNTNSGMVQSAFKLLTSLLRSKTAEDIMEGNITEANAPQVENANAKKRRPLLTETQLRDLIDFIRPDIEEPEHQATAFGLIRAIMSRRMIVDSLYSLVDTIRELMITAQSAKMQETCRLTWFQFLMDYPLGERRLANAMNFIVQNTTGYVYENGRSSALEMMTSIIRRFADELFLPHAAEPFFLALVLVIVKDESAKCREMATHLLPELVERLDAPRLNRVWILLDQWTAGIKASAAPISASPESKSYNAALAERTKARELGRAALQCYGIIIDPLGSKFDKHIASLLDALDDALTVSLRSWKSAEAKLNLGSNNGPVVDLEKAAKSLGANDDPQEEALAYWETAYTALNTFSRFVNSQSQKHMFGGERQARIWLLVKCHLTHPHAWVRLAAARLFGSYVANADPSWMLDATPKTTDVADSTLDDRELWEFAPYEGDPRYVLMSFGTLREIALLSIVQLNGRYLSDELGLQVVKNMYFIAKCFLTAVSQNSRDANDAYASEDETDSKLEGAINDSHDGDGGIGANSNINNEVDHKALPIERGLIWLINRVGRIARTELIHGRGSTRKRMFCFRFFAAVVSTVPKDLLSVSAYIMPIMSPLHRTQDDMQAPREPVTLADGTVKTPEEQVDDLKALASEVLQLTQNKMGTTEFTAVLHKIKSYADRVREERREQRKQLAIIDPELHAKRKAKKHESSKRNRAERNRDLARKKVRTAVRKSRGIDSMFK